MPAFSTDFHRCVSCSASSVVGRAVTVAAGSSIACRPSNRRSRHRLRCQSGFVAASLTYFHMSGWTLTHKTATQSSWRRLVGAPGTTHVVLGPDVDHLLVHHFVANDAVRVFAALHLSDAVVE